MRAWILRERFQANTSAKAHHHIAVNRGHPLHTADTVVEFENGMTIFKSMVNGKLKGKTRRKFQWGGAREGAGRPPTGKPKIKVTVSLTTEVYERAVKLRPTSFSNLVEMLLDQHAPNPIN